MGGVGNFDEVDPRVHSVGLITIQKVCTFVYFMIHTTLYCAFIYSIVLPVYNNKRVTKGCVFMNNSWSEPSW